MAENGMAAGGSQTGQPGTGFSVPPNNDGSGGLGNANGGNGGNGGTGSSIELGAGGGGGGVGFGGGGGGVLAGGGGGAGYGGGGGSAEDGGGGGGSSFVAPSATGVSPSATHTGGGLVTITDDPTTDACPTVAVAPTAAFTG